MGGVTFTVGRQKLQSRGRRAPSGALWSATRRPLSEGPRGRSIREQTGSAGEKAATPRWRILVVDDDIDAATSLAVILEFEGYDVRTAFDGESALQMVDSFQPELTILDIAMPKMDGFEVCRRLRAGPNGQRMAIAALSGFGQARDKRQSRKAGFDIHMVKPIDPSDLDHLLSILMPRAH